MSVCQRLNQRMSRFCRQAEKAMTRAREREREREHQKIRQPIEALSRPIRQKRNRARRGPGSVRRRGGADDHLPEGNCCLHCGCHLGGWGNRLASQHDDYARCTRDAQRKALHVSHAKNLCAVSGIYAGYICTRCDRTSQRRARLHRVRAAIKASEIPALRVGDEEIAKSLHARDRFKLFRIDKVGIERHSLGLAE
jgi:hypothetical protein